MIVSMKPNISVPGHFLEDRSSRNRAGVGDGSTEGSTHMTGDDVKPLHFLKLAANTSSWNHMK